jgi:Leucine-rich repeat (LRR) protein
MRHSPNLNKTENENLMKLAKDVGEISEKTTNRLIGRCSFISEKKKIVSLEITPFNPIQNISEILGDFKDLKHLTINGTSIKKLPKSIGSLSNLESLEIINNMNLKQIPTSIGNLSSLETLKIFRTKVSKLPETIGLLKNLVNLDCHSNLISYFPKSICNLNELEVLNLNFNPLRVLSGKFLDLKKLREFNIESSLDTPILISKKTSQEIQKLQERCNVVGTQNLSIVTNEYIGEKVIQLINKDMHCITKEIQDDFHHLYVLLLEDDNILAFFLEFFEDQYFNKVSSSLELPSLLGFLTGIHNNNQLFPVFITYTQKLLDSKDHNKVFLGLHILKNNHKFFQRDKNYYDKLISFLSHEEDPIIEMALSVLSINYYSYLGKLYKKLDFFGDFVINSKNPIIICLSMKLFGHLYLQFIRNGKGQQYRIDLIDKMVKNYILLKSEDEKAAFWDGFSSLLYELNSYSSNWIEILITEFKNNKSVALQGTIIKCFSYLPQKVELAENDERLIVNFFSEILQNLLNAKTIEYPNNSVIVNPNHVQDVMSGIEQISFSNLKIVSRLLPLYEKVYEKIVLRNIDGNFTNQLFKQWIHAIYIHLIAYHKKIMDSDNTIKYLEKAIPVCANDKQKLNLQISLYQHEIRKKILNRDFKNSKKIFLKLNESFLEFEKLNGKNHTCYPFWKILEHFLFITTCDSLEYTRNIEALEIDLVKFQKKIPEQIKFIIKKWKTIPSNKIKIQETHSFQDCEIILFETKKVIDEMMEETENMDYPIIQNILENLQNEEKTKILDISQQKCVEIISTSRKTTGLPKIESIHEQQFYKAIKILSTLNLEYLFPNKIPKENSEINPKLVEILKQEFNNVELNAPLSGSSHIDILITKKIAIEVKILKSNNTNDVLVGQILEDMRILNLPFGIMFGIDETKRKNMIRNNQYFKKTEYGWVCMVILSNPYIKRKI